MKTMKLLYLEEPSLRFGLALRWHSKPYLIHDSDFANDMLKIHLFSPDAIDKALVLMREPKLQAISDLDQERTFFLARANLPVPLVLCFLIGHITSLLN
jgi:hypothetical protein